MSKPKSIRVSSDDCAVKVGGQTYYPHEGEWVELLPLISAGSNRVTLRIMQMQDELLAAEGDPDEIAQKVRILDDINAQICATLADRVLAWTWTDDASRPLPAPAGDPAVFYGLHQEEVMWLWTAVQQSETEAARKNGSRPSPTSGSATRRPPSRTSSGGGRSRTRG